MGNLLLVDYIAFFLICVGCYTVFHYIVDVSKHTADKMIQRHVKDLHKFNLINHSFRGQEVSINGRAYKVLDYYNGEVTLKKVDSDQYVSIRTSTTQFVIERPTTKPILQDLK